MTANIYEKNGKYHVILSWYQNNERKQKSVSTGISVQGNNVRRAKVEMERIQKEWENKVTESFQDILFSDYLMEWLQSVKCSIAETTYYSYKHTIEKMICPYFAARKIKLCDLKPFHIQKFYAWKQEGDGASGNTIHHYHANIRKALKDAVRTELIRDNPADKLILPKKEKFHGDYYTSDELRKLVDAVKGTKLEVPVMLAALLGLRRGEVVGVRWSAIDFASMKLYICGTVTNKGPGTPSEKEVYRKKGKTDTSIRMFPLTEASVNYLKKLKATQEENHLLAGNCYNTKFLDFVCVDQLGNLIHLDYITNTFPETLVKLGMKRIRFHDLRHTNITLLLEEGATLKEVQDWAGHKDISTTANIYAHVQAKAKLRLANAMDSILSGCN